jgi:hypothetical protein
MLDILNKSFKTYNKKKNSTDIWGSASVTCINLAPVSCTTNNKLSFVLKVEFGLLLNIGSKLNCPSKNSNIFRHVKDVPN